MNDFGIFRQKQSETEKAENGVKSKLGKFWIIRLRPTGQNSSHIRSRRNDPGGSEKRNPRISAPSPQRRIRKEFARKGGLQFSRDYGILNRLSVSPCNWSNEAGFMLSVEC